MDGSVDRPDEGAEELSLTGVIFTEKVARLAAFEEERFLSLA